MIRHEADAFSGSLARTTLSSGQPFVASFDMIFTHRRVGA
jgi:hypothetical protein